MSEYVRSNNVLIQVTTDFKTSKNLMYVKESKSMFTPDEVAELMIENHCELVSFYNSLKVFEIENLKGKDDWRGIKART
jgi:hypothetical protein